MAVLVLNASLEPLAVVEAKRAIVLLWRGVAEIVEEADARIRSERLSLPMPLVIRLVRYVPVAYRRVNVALTRRAILARDGRRCQYCGRVEGELTIDHVLPRSRGGATSWVNCVAACVACNQRKGNRTPEEAGMPLPRRPAPPTARAGAHLRGGAIHPAWLPYLA